jgi:hypothetical protein
MYDFDMSMQNPTDIDAPEEFVSHLSQASSGITPPAMMQSKAAGAKRTQTTKITAQRTLIAIPMRKRLDRMIPLGMCSPDPGAKNAALSRKSYAYFAGTHLQRSASRVSPGLRQTSEHRLVRGRGSQVHLPRSRIISGAHTRLHGGDRTCACAVEPMPYQTAAMIGNASSAYFMRISPFSAATRFARRFPSRRKR